MADLKNRRHLFFDLDDTLWDFDKNSGKVLHELFHEYELAQKLTVDFNVFHTHYKKVNLQLWTKYYRREIDKQYLRHERFHEVFRHFGYDNYTENLAITEEYLSRAPHGTCLMPGCTDVLDYLKEKYTLHIITNGFKEIQHIKIKGCGLGAYFKNIIISEEYELVKPDEKIFRLSESLAGCSKDECVMIGDSYESDIAGALNAGWEAIHFTAHPVPHSNVRVIDDLQQLKNIF
jgi:putative hydrolase of the HAD superfamily